MLGTLLVHPDLAVSLENDGLQDLATLGADGPGFLRETGRTRVFYSCDCHKYRCEDGLTLFNIVSVRATSIPPAYQRIMLDASLPGYVCV